MNIFVKTKNVPNVLKCKINHNFFFSQTWGSQTRGRGSPTWEKFQHFPVFFWTTSLSESGQMVSEKSEMSIFIMFFDLRINFRNVCPGKCGNSSYYTNQNEVYFLFGSCVCTAVWLHVFQDLVNSVEHKL